MSPLSSFTVQHLIKQRILTGNYLHSFARTRVPGMNYQNQTLKRKKSFNTFIIFSGK